MSLEAIQRITDAEEAARQVKLRAEATAKATITDTEKKGQAAVAEAVQRAEEEVKKLLADADEKAANNAAELKMATSKLVDDLRRKAEARLDSAALVIVERIVQG